MWDTVCGWSWFQGCVHQLLWVSAFFFVLSYSQIIQSCPFPIPGSGCVNTISSLEQCSKRLRGWTLTWSLFFLKEKLWARGISLSSEFWVFLAWGRGHIWEVKFLFLPFSMWLILGSMVQWGARTPQLDSRALIKAFSSVDGCQMSVSMGRQGLEPLILPSYSYHFSSPSTLLILCAENKTQTPPTAYKDWGVKSY